MYKPDTMLFLMSPATEPKDVALAIKLVMTNNPYLKTLMPHHHRLTPPPGVTTSAEVRAALDAVGVNIPIINQEVGQV